MMSKQLHMAAYLLLWVGGLNWGMVGIFNTNVVTMILGEWPVLVKLVYTAVGVSAAYVIATHKNYCSVCMDEKPSKRKK